MNCKAAEPLRWPPRNKLLKLCEEKLLFYTLHIRTGMASSIFSSLQDGRRAYRSVILHLAFAQKAAQR